MTQEKLERALNSGAARAQDLTDLSDLSPSQLADLRPIWQSASNESRVRLLQRLRELAEDNVEYDFERLFLMALDDTNPEVRSAAIEGLWEAESAYVLDRLCYLLCDDASSDVRCAAATALGRFAFLAALGSLSEPDLRRLRKALVDAIGEAPDGSDLQMRSVEALAYLPEDEVARDQIGRLYREGGEDEQASALLAMGRSMDPRWTEAVAQELESESARIRFQAARAAGEMGREQYVPALADLLDDDDLEVALAAVWALGQIGGHAATRLLERLSESDDGVIAEAAEEALGEAAYSGEYEE